MVRFSIRNHHWKAENIYFQVVQTGMRLLKHVRYLEIYNEDIITCAAL